MRTVAIVIFVTFSIGCSEPSSSSSNQDTQGAATGTDLTDSADSTEGTDGADANDGADTTDSSESTDSVDFRNCQFPIPAWWKCNPWPNCVETGCAKGEYCTLVTGTPISVECVDKGDVAQGGACNHDGGPYCSKGLCVDGECRLWCNDSSDCDNSVCKAIGGGPKSEVTACGASQAACDPLTPNEGCEGNQVCYYQQSSGISTCMDTQKAGKDGAECTDCPNCCAPGQACVVHESKQICGHLCVADGDGSPACQEVCAQKDTEQQVKSLSGGLGACVPKGTGGSTTPPVPCDILKQDCGGEAQACYSTNDGDQCLVKGNAPKGAECSNVNDCTKGTTCWAKKCKAICDPNGGLDNENCDVTQFKCTPLPSSTGGYCDE